MGLFSKNEDRLLKTLTPSEREKIHIEQTYRHLVFVVKDEKGRCFNIPFYQNSVEVAMRALMHALKNTAEILAQFPQDFSLYHIGYFDEREGVLVPLEKILLICRLDELALAQKTSEVSNALPSNGR